MKKTAILLWLLVVFLSFFTCGCTGGTAAEHESGILETGQEESEQKISTASLSEMFTQRDMEIEYDENTSTRITLSGDSASSDSDAVQISDSTVTITDEGTYILSGILNDGMITVCAQETDKIQLVLDNVEITSATSAAIYVLEADKVFITTASGSENILTNGGQYIAVDDNNIDAVIFSKSDLTLNGAGTLNINAASGHGVVSKDDLILTGGTYKITAASQGLSGKDSVRIADGTYTITSGKDGIHTENTDDASMGFLYIAGGTFMITAEGDGMSAGYYLQIEDGTFAITAGEGSSSVTMPVDTMRGGQQGGVQEQMKTTATDENSVSQKGIKAEGVLTITDGTFVTDTADDSIHSNSNIFITGGEFELRTGDDAVHSDKAVSIQNGTFIIAYCYEGIEGLAVTIEDGTFDITSEDDGINAAGGTDSSGFGGRAPDQERFADGADMFITINSGNFVITANGDCLDSNGSLTINGGTLNLTCNGNGNTAIDCDGTYANNGGDVTTNDGSENNPGQMGGGMGAQGGMGQGRGGH